MINRMILYDRNYPELTENEISLFKTLFKTN